MNSMQPVQGISVIFAQLQRSVILYLEEQSLSIFKITSFQRASISESSDVRHNDNKALQVHVIQQWARYSFAKIALSRRCNRENGIFLPSLPSHLPITSIIGAHWAGQSDDRGDTRVVCLSVSHVIDVCCFRISRQYRGTSKRPHIACT